MEDFRAKPKVPARTRQIPSSPVRLPCSNHETTHSQLPPPISPKSRQSSDAVEYDDILTAKQYKLKSTAPKITSRLYKLEEFAKSFTLPQIVRASGGSYENIGKSNLGEAEEVALLFSKATKTVLAHLEGENYDIPLNSTFEFGPCNEKDKSSHHNYETIQELLVGNTGLPAVVKVLKSYKGKTEESSVVAGSLIFPQKLTSHPKKQKKNTGMYQ